MTALPLSERGARAMRALSLCDQIAERNRLLAIADECRQRGDCGESVLCELEADKLYDQIVATKPVTAGEAAAQLDAIVRLEDAGNAISGLATVIEGLREIAAKDGAL